MPRPLIDLMIAGAEKAATSSLKDYLGQHPLAVTHQAREFTCFVNDRDYQAGYDRAFDAHFTSPSADQRIIAKSVGVMYQSVAQQRLIEHNPRVQLAVLLRNPVERAYSAFHFARQQGWETLTDFDAALDAGIDRFGDDWVRARACDYLQRSRYAPHLRGCFGLFGKQNVHVFLLEELVQDPGQVCRALFNVLGIDPDVTIDWRTRNNPGRSARSQVLAKSLSSTGPLKRIARMLLPGTTAKRIKHTARRLNRTQSAPPPLRGQTRARLIRLFEQDNHELAEMIGRDLGAWSQDPLSR